LSQENIASHSTADSAEEGHDQQTNDRIATIVRWIASNQYAVQGVYACGKQIDVRKAGKIHFNCSLN